MISIKKSKDKRLLLKIGVKSWHLSYKEAQKLAGEIITILYTIKQAERIDNYIFRRGYWMKDKKGYTKGVITFKNGTSQICYYPTAKQIKINNKKVDKLIDKLFSCGFLGGADWPKGGK